MQKSFNNLLHFAGRLRERGSLANTSRRKSICPHRSPHITDRLLLRYLHHINSITLGVFFVGIAMCDSHGNSSERHLSATPCEAARISHLVLSKTDEFENRLP